MSNVPGHYHAEGDPPGTVRYWDGSQWVGDPMPAPPAGAAAPPPPPTGGVDASRFATLGIRFGAAIIDGLIYLAFTFVLLLIFFENEADGPGFSATADGGETVVLSLVLWAIFLVILITQSATPGKLTLGLTVRKADGVTAIDPKSAFMRSVPFLVGLLPVLNIIIPLVMVIGSIIGITSDDERRSLYDRIANTRVVYKSKL